MLDTKNWDSALARLEDEIEQAQAVPRREVDALPLYEAAMERVYEARERWYHAWPERGPIGMTEEEWQRVHRERQRLLHSQTILTQASSLVEPDIAR